MNVSVWMTGWVLAVFLSAPVQAAGSDTSPGISVQDAWIRPAPPSAPVRAGYARLENRGDQAVGIDAVMSESFGAIEIHEMHEVEGVMRMRRVPRLDIAPGGIATLQPGGLHLMLFRPRSPMEEGAKVTLVFSSGGREVARGEFTVRAPE
ncbi:copper chaperone PCu(A)C [Xanthomonadaceae bacterium JHOS43]|nr:copper chaperone PCu(A)C [Xanthomonadaceae bacterium JHOS43]